MAAGRTKRKLYFRREPGGVLVPMDDAARERIATIANRSILAVQITQPRNIRRHRLYWALMQRVWEAVYDDPRFPTAEDVSEAIKMLTGWREVRQAPDGLIYFRPCSIAFHNMDETEFSAFLTRAIEAVERYFLPGIDQQELRDEIDAMIHPDPHHHEERTTA